MQLPRSDLRQEPAVNPSMLDDATLFVDVYRAKGASSRRPPKLSLVAREEFPDVLRSAYDLGRDMVIHQANAEAIVDALSRCLPGGTLDRVAALLMQRMASRLVVPLQRANEPDPAECQNPNS